jgi:hypothetical protein
MEGCSILEAAAKALNQNSVVSVAQTIIWSGIDYVVRVWIPAGILDIVLFTMQPEEPKETVQRVFSESWQCISQEYMQ